MDLPDNFRRDYSSIPTKELLELLQEALNIGFLEPSIEEGFTCNYNGPEETGENECTECVFSLSSRDCIPCHDIEKTNPKIYELVTKHFPELFI